MNDSPHSGHRPAPDPHAAQTPTEFTAQLRQLKSWSGLTYRQLERRANLVGDVLPYSTIATTLGRTRLPRDDFVMMYVRACGGDAEMINEWVTARRRVANASVHPQPIAPSPGTSSPLSSLLPVRLGRPLLRFGALGLVVLVLSFFVRASAHHSATEAVRSKTSQGASASTVATAPAGPVGWWRFDEKKGETVAKDRSGSGFDAVLSDSATRTAATGGKALLLDGTGHATARGPNVRTDIGFSVTAWARLDTDGRWATVVGMHDGLYDCFLLTYDSGIGRWAILTPKGTDGDAIGNVVSKIRRKLHVWTHLTAVFDPAAARLHLYVNGRLAGTGIRQQIRQPTGGMDFGRATAREGTLDYMIGAIDDVRIYNRPLAPEQIRQVMNSRT